MGFDTACNNCVRKHLKIIKFYDINQERCSVTYVFLIKKTRCFFMILHKNTYLRIRYQKYIMYKTI